MNFPQSQITNFQKHDHAEGHMFGNCSVHLQICLFSREDSFHHPPPFLQKVYLDSRSVTELQPQSRCTVYTTIVQPKLFLAWCHRPNANRFPGLKNLSFSCSFFEGHRFRVTVPSSSSWTMILIPPPPHDNIVVVVVDDNFPSQPQRHHYFHCGPR